MRCRHCGEYIDTRFREADGSVSCPGCGANYRAKAKAPEEGKTIRVDRDTYQRQSLLKQRPMPSVVRNQPNKSGKRKKSFFQSAVLAVLLLIAVTASALLLYEKYSGDDIFKSDLSVTDFFTDAKQKLLSFGKRNSENSDQVQIGGDDQNQIGGTTIDKVLSAIDKRTTEEAPILDVPKTSTVPIADTYLSEDTHCSAGQVDLNGAWNEIYRHFIMDQTFWTFKTDAPSGITVSFYNEETHRPIRFGLHDMNQDGTPELIAFNGCAYEAASYDIAFTAENGDISYIGTLGTRECQLYYFGDDHYPGLACTDGNMGYYTTYYYSFTDGQIQNEKILNYDYNVPDGGWAEEATIIRKTSIDALYNLELNGEKHEFKQFTLDEIRTIGWESFIDYYYDFGLSANNTASDSSNDVIPFEMNADQQYAANIFLSNFAEQGVFNHFNINNPDIDQLVDFAYLFCKINRRKDTILEFRFENGAETQYFYTVSLEDVNEVLDRHFGIQLNEEMAKRFPVDSNPNEHYLNGVFYFPAADGEAYNRIAIARTAEALGNGTFRLKFDVFSLDIGEYHARGIDWSYYHLTTAQAQSTSSLTWLLSGTAIVIPYKYYDRDTFQLIEYSTNSASPYSGVNTENFSIIGAWKSIGSEGFGQAQPGMITIFEGNHCNFYSPYDTFTIVKVSDRLYRLDVTSFLFDENLTFDVRVKDKNNIEIDNGRVLTSLRRTDLDVKLADITKRIEGLTDVDKSDYQDVFGDIAQSVGNLVVGLFGRE